jgi:hypothetical protein
LSLVVECYILIELVVHGDIAHFWVVHGKKCNYPYIYICVCVCVCVCVLPKRVFKGLGAVKDLHNFFVDSDLVCSIRKIRKGYLLWK